MSITVEPYKGFSLDALKELIAEIKETAQEAEQERNAELEEDDQEGADFEDNCDFLVNYFPELAGYNTCHEDKNGGKCNCANDPLLNAGNDNGVICCMREAEKDESKRYAGCFNCEFPCHDIQRVFELRGLL